MTFRIIMCSRLLCVLLVGQFAYAHDLNISSGRLSQCTNIQPDLERLACFDEAVADASQPKTQLKQLGKWEIREKISPATGEIEQVTLILDADFGQSSAGDNITLVTRCRANLTDMYIIWGDTLEQHQVPIVVKLGDEDAQTEWWERSKSLKTTFRDRATHLLRDMMRHEKAVFQIKIKQNPVTAVFDISGLRAVLKPVRELCNWTH